MVNHNDSSPGRIPEPLHAGDVAPHVHCRVLVSTSGSLIQGIDDDQLQGAKSICNCFYKGSCAAVLCGSKIELVAHEMQLESVILRATVNLPCPKTLSQARRPLCGDVQDAA